MGARTKAAHNAGVARAYLITFHTYATWLHGEAKGSVEPGMNQPGTPYAPHDPAKLRRDEDGMRTAPVVFDRAQRAIVEHAIRAVCAHKGWRTHALEVRTNHVHLVVSAGVPPERVLNACKAWSTRALREHGLLAPDAPAWSRHGSTRWLNSDDSLIAACDYVTRLQTPEAVRHRMAKRARPGERDAPGGQQGMRETQGGVQKEME